MSEGVAGREAAVAVAAGAAETAFRGGARWRSPTGRRLRGRPARCAVGCHGTCSAARAVARPRRRPARAAARWEAVPSALRSFQLTLTTLGKSIRGIQFEMQ